jgi:hypothetical protein
MISSLSPIPSAAQGLGGQQTSAAIIGQSSGDKGKQQKISEHSVFFKL